MIVLDTHALVWWINKDDSRLSSVAADAIEQALAGDGVVASSISAWELAMLVSKGKLDLTVDVLDWLEAAASIDGFDFVPVDNIVAVKSRTLPGDFHPDPADRIIVALARELGAPLVTADAKITQYPHVATIW
ncbi:type II toxin-antitoxin system VapC family toxin [Mesorhizobium sp. DCY119]|uniref:type II toxin-antitoxin system VapC family toxin n=1 Tax=Mesorhizobium sp. DCY119 TaxID=2108445 RepID=UPI000E6C721C|nr:type II toxin-antitoxin system VapC family toxin [Mesorhizobium sp. DCY119]RJG43823.1 type II toxin-antitoxin system VapC family toxin [Mesorhizobium sp. DCY119]